MKRNGATLGAAGVVCLAAAIAVMAVIMVAGARAQAVWRVNTTVDNAVSGAECQGVAGDCSLRQAIDRATSSGGTIKLPAGHYTLSAGLGQLTISPTSLSIVGAGAGKTIIDGAGAGRVFFVNSNAGLTLTGVTVTGGDVTATFGDGGDILNWGTLTISHSAVRNGKAYFYGGDIESTPTPSSAAPIRGAGYAPTVPTLSITDSTISGGSAQQLGGGIDIGFGESGIITGSRITGNHVTTSDGGGGGGINDESDGLSISKSAISGNTVQCCSGGGIYENGSGASITDSTISGNRDGNAALGYIGSGGGIYDNSTGMSITNSTIVDNAALDGGSGGGTGGGIYDNGGLVAKDATIAGNAASDAGNLYFNDTSSGGLQGTIVADPKVPSGSTATPTNCDTSGVIPASQGHNLEDDAPVQVPSSGFYSDACGFGIDSTTGQLDPTLNDITGKSPDLGSLANNGGPTKTMALKTGSPAINAGVKIKGINADQRGGPRPQPATGAPDIGAYEYGAIIDLGINETAAHPITVGHHLTYVLGATNHGPAGDAALAVHVVDNLPSSVKFASAAPAGSCTNASGKVTCALGTIAHGATEHVRITVIPQKVGFPTDSSSVSSGALDPKLSNNKSGVTVPVQDKPAVHTDLFSALDYHGATLHGKVNPNNAQTTYYFEYGPTTSYGSRTASSHASGLSAVAVTLPVQGLHPGRLYHYRVVAVNAVGTSPGSDQAFFTYFLPVLHVSPAQVRPGASLRVYGNAGECPAGDTVTLLSPAFSNAHTYQGEGAIYTTVHHHGFFSTSTMIPSSRHRGTYPVSGLCGHFPTGAAGDAGAAGARASVTRTGAGARWTGRLTVG